jgi:hypothetical protein
MPAHEMLRLSGTMPRNQSDVNEDTWHEKNCALDKHLICTARAHAVQRTNRESSGAVLWRNQTISFPN